MPVQEWQDVLFEVASVAARCPGVRKFTLPRPLGDCPGVDAKHLGDFRGHEQLFVLQAVLFDHGSTNLPGV